MKKMKLIEAYENGYFKTHYIVVNNLHKFHLITSEVIDDPLMVSILLSSGEIRYGRETGWLFIDDKPAYVFEKTESGISELIEMIKENNINSVFVRLGDKDNSIIKANLPFLFYLGEHIDNPPSILEFCKEFFLFDGNDYSKYQNLSFDEMRLQEEFLCS